MTDIETFPPSRKYKLLPDDVLRQNGIEIQQASRYYTTCPRCSAKRSTQHQKLKCLGVTRPDDDRVYWGCNHCDWTGPGPQHGTSRPGRPRRPRVGKPAPASVSTRTIYNYSDHLRKVKVVRPDGEKKVWWEHKSKGWWESGTGGIATDHLLYRLETAKKMAVALRLPICIVEGEKDVDVLMHHGFPATCSAHGASEPNKAPKWYREHSDKLLGLALAVFNDADAAGRAHSRAICEQCYRRAKSIVVVDQETHFPGHKDIADAFKAGLDKGTLRDFIEGAPEYGT